MATAEFSSLAGILSAALSQHHLLAFSKNLNSLTEIPLPPLALFIVMLPKHHLTFHQKDVMLKVSDHTFVIIWVMKTFFV